MAWDFETDSGFQAKLDWMDEFVTRECEPLDLVFRGPADPFDPARKGPAAAMAPLKEIVKQQGLWACHLGEELGGQGYGQVKLGLMNEILGRSRFAPTVFGTQAPDTGNMEILARFGTPEQKQRYLEPLMAGEIASCYSMTEPQAGADPGQFTCRAELKGDHWVINGEKWFASHADFARFLLVVVVTDTSVPIHEGASILIVDRETPASRWCATSPRASTRPSAPGCTATCASPTAACRRRTCSARPGAASRWRKPASAAAASTMRCAPSAC
jgi:acyl-CoA dehydrogenase